MTNRRHMTKEWKKAARALYGIDGAEEPTSAAEEFVQEMAELGKPLPWHVKDNDCGVLVDADGVPVLIVDEGGELPDGIVLKIAANIMCAVNTCGGFKAELQ